MQNGSKWCPLANRIWHLDTLGQAARGTGKLRIAEPTKPAFKNPHRLDCRAFVGFICFKEQTNWTFWCHVSVYKKCLQVVEKLSPKPRSLLASGTPETKIHQSLVRKTWCVFSHGRMGWNRIYMDFPWCPLNLLTPLSFILWLGHKGSTHGFHGRRG